MQQVVLHTYVVYLQQQYEISSYLHLKPQAKFEEILSTNGTHSLSSYNCGCKYLMTKKFKKTKFIGPLVHTFAFAIGFSNDF